MDPSTQITAIGVLMAVTLALAEVIKLLISKVGDNKNIRASDLLKEIIIMKQISARLETTLNDPDSKVSTVKLQMLPQKVHTLEQSVDDLKAEVHEGNRDLRGVIDRNTAALHELSRTLTELKVVLPKANGQ